MIQAECETEIEKALDLVCCVLESKAYLDALDDLACFERRDGILLAGGSYTSTHITLEDLITHTTHGTSLLFTIRQNWLVGSTLHATGSIGLSKQLLVTLKSYKCQTGYISSPPIPRRTPLGD